MLVSDWRQDTIQGVKLAPWHSALRIIHVLTTGYIKCSFTSHNKIAVTVELETPGATLKQFLL